MACAHSAWWREMGDSPEEEAVGTQGFEGAPLPPPHGGSCREILWHGGLGIGVATWLSTRRWWPEGFSDQGLEKAASLD